MQQHIITAEVLRWALLASRNTGTRCRWAAMAAGHSTTSTCNRNPNKTPPHPTPSQLAPMTRGDVGWLMSKVFIGGGNAAVRGIWGAGIAELMREDPHMLTPPTPKPPPTPEALRSQLARVARSARRHTTPPTTRPQQPERYALAG